jgi:hypothetical protein
MPAQMTSTAWGQGVKNASIMMTAILVVYGITTAAIVLIFEQPIFRSLGVSGGALCVLAQLVFFGTWFHGRSVAGRVLLDCGRHPTWWLFLVNAVIFALTGLLNGMDPILKLIEGPDAASLPSWFGIGLPVMMISFVPYWFVMAGGRLQLREGGVWQYWGLLRWEKIASYRWASDATLLVKAKGLFSFFQGALPVAPEQKQAVEELLAKHCPAAANA